MAELARRQTIAQKEATQAQKTASEAEEKAAMRPDSRLLQTAKDFDDKSREHRHGQVSCHRTRTLDRSRNGCSYI